MLCLVASFVVELTYPIGEGFSNGMMTSTALLLGTGVSYLAMFLCKLDAENVQTHGKEGPFYS